MSAAIRLRPLTNLSMACCEISLDFFSFPAAYEAGMLTITPQVLTRACVCVCIFPDQPLLFLDCRPAYVVPKLAKKQSAEDHRIFCRLRLLSSRFLPAEVPQNARSHDKLRQNRSLCRSSPVECDCCWLAVWTCTAQLIAFVIILSQHSISHSLLCNFPTQQLTADS
jgi:hypothetical protein